MLRNKHTNIAINNTKQSQTGLNWKKKLYTETTKYQSIPWSMKFCP